MRKAKPHFVLIKTEQDNLGKGTKATYEGLKPVPKFPLFQKLDNIDFLFPRFSKIVEFQNKSELCPAPQSEHVSTLPHRAAKGTKEPEKMQQVWLQHPITSL